MLIALTIVLLGGGGNDIWLFPEDFTDQVEEVVLEEKRQSEILDLFDKINESVNSQNDGIKDLAEKMSLFNRNPDTTEKEIEEILQNILRKRKVMQTEILDARLKMANLLQPNEWEHVFSMLL